MDTPPQQPPDGLPPALVIRMGNKPGASLRVKAPHWEVQRKRGHVVDVHVTSFKEVAVVTSGTTPSGEKTNRCVILVPGDDENRIEWHGFYVTGKFRISDKVWDPNLAHQMFKEFQPE